MSMPSVSLRPPLRVDPRWRDHLRMPVGADAYLPFDVGMDEPVVEPAQHHHVVQ
jgi:hypothetical protein